MSSHFVKKNETFEMWILWKNDIFRNMNFVKIGIFNMLIFGLNVNFCPSVLLWVPRDLNIILEKMLFVRISDFLSLEFLWHSPHNLTTKDLMNSLSYSSPHSKSNKSSDYKKSIKNCQETFFVACPWYAKVTLPWTS